MRFGPSPAAVLALIALLVGVVAALTINLGAFATIRAGGNRTTDAMLRVEALLSSVTEAESGARGYLLSGNGADLDLYRQAVRDFEADFAAARSVATDAGRRNRIEAIGNLAQGRLEALRTTVELHREAGMGAALALAASGEGRRLMRSLREEVSALRQDIARDREEEQSRAWRRAIGGAVLVVGAGTLATLLPGLLVLVCRRALTRRGRSIEALLQERAGAEFERLSAVVLLDALPVGVMLADAAGSVLRTNTEAASIWGKAAPVAAEDSALTRALRTGKAVTGEVTRIRRADGEEQVVLNSAAPVRDAEGRLLGAIAILQDITERQHEQDRLLEAEAHYRAIVETAADAIATISETGIIRSFNPAAERVFGYSAAEVIGRNIGLLMPAAIAGAHDGAIARYIASREQSVRWIGREVTGRRKDGTEFPLELSLAEWRAGNGERRFTGLMRDVTEDRRAEDALRTSDRRVRELQAEFLHVARLSEMGQMAAALAHELNQPLAAAANYVNGSRRMLDGDDTDAVLARLPMVRDALAAAAKQTIQVGTIIRRMRSFVDRGDGERRSEDLAELVSEAIELVSLPARQRHVEIRLEIGPPGLRVLAERTQVQQVLVCLMYNAIEAMEESERRLLSVTSCLGEDGMAQIAVADTGPGIPAEIEADLFRPFVTTKSNGMGVGLSVCRSIIEAHGGRIETHPNPGGGAIFRFTLDAAPAAADEATSARQDVPSGQASSREEIAAQSGPALSAT